MEEFGDLDSEYIKKLIIALKRTGNAESRRSLKKAMNSQTAELEARCDGFASTSLAYENAQPCASSDPDVFNVLLTEQQLHADPSRPRQYGRRSNPVRISSFAIESSDNGAAVSRRLFAPTS